MLRILEAVGGLLLSGTAVLSGRYLGAGKLDRTRGVCSLSLTVAFLVGSLLTILSFAAPQGIARLLGADAKLTVALSYYVMGYAVGILPQLLGQQFAACLQLERQDRRGRLGILVMIVCNAALDLLFVIRWKMGTFGLALATSVSNWAYFAVVAGYYLTKKAQLKPDLKLIDWGELPQMVKIGLPCTKLPSPVHGRLKIEPCTKPRHSTRMSGPILFYKQGIYRHKYPFLITPSRRVPGMMRLTAFTTAFSFAS